jgi:hypothetical protein
VCRAWLRVCSQQRQVLRLGCLQLPTQQPQLKAAFILNITNPMHTPAALSCAHLIHGVPGVACFSAPCILLLCPEFEKIRLMQRTNMEVRAHAPLCLVAVALHSTVAQLAAVTGWLPPGASS